jgi:hypothetical protein
LPSHFRSLAEAYPILVVGDFPRVSVPRPGTEALWASEAKEDEILQDLYEMGDTEGYVPFPQPGGLITALTEVLSHCPDQPITITRARCPPRRRSGVCTTPYKQAQRLAFAAEPVIRCSHNPYATDPSAPASDTAATA